MTRTPRAWSICWKTACGTSTPGSSWKKSRETIDARLIDEEDDVDTIGGLAFTLAGHLMKPGESVEHASGWRIECVEADTKRVLRLRLYAPEPAEDVTG